MGISMMDFFVRETRGVTVGPIVIVRFGTCGGLSEDTPPGSVVIASHGSGFVSRNPDAFYEDSDKSVIPYNFHRISSSNELLNSLVVTELNRHVGSKHVVQGLNVTAVSHMIR